MPSEWSISARKKRVVVLMPLQTTRGRNVLRGVLRYNQPSWRWELRSQLANAASCDAAEEWGADGIIANAHDEPLIQRLRRFSVPVVNMSGRVSPQPFPQVTIDYATVGRIAAEYFLSKGYRSYAILSDMTSAVAIQRSDGFRQQLAKAGFAPSIRTIDDDHGVFSHWEMADEPLTAWLRSLPKPVAIFTDDLRGPVLSQLCASIGVAVPEHAAILGVDNDELQCQQAHPPLSSIDIPYEEAGYQAAKLLDSLMSRAKAGVPSPAERIVLQPNGVITRASTDILAIEDADVAAAVRFIATHAHERIKAGDVVDAVSIGRRVLETRFRKVTGRTLLEEIHRVCVEHAKLILARTSKPFPTVAGDAGFRDTQHLWLVFKKMVGVSPMAYRKSQRS